MFLPNPAISLNSRIASRAAPSTEPVRRGERSRLWEGEFDARLGPDTRRVVYCHVLDHPAQVRALFAPGVSLTERLLARASYPLLKRAIRRGLRVTPEATERSTRRIDKTFASIAERLADGRRYLVGDRFSAADLTFAALSAPLLLPHGYGVPLPSVDEVPPGLAQAVRRYRSTGAGEFALRLYREERHRVLPASAAALA